MKETWKIDFGNLLLHLTCKLEKQLFRVVSCIESYFPQTLAKSL